MHRVMMANLLLAVSICVAGGCNILTAVDYLTADEPTVEAMYVLPDRPTVVFVDDRRNLLSPRRLRVELADRVSEELQIHDNLSATISPRDAMSVADMQDKHRQLMSVAGIGREVGADQVVYLEMMRFQLSADGYSIDPVIQCNVRVIDVTDRERVFPVPGGNDTSYPVTATLRKVSPDRLRSVAARADLSQELVIELGDTVSRLFRKWEPGLVGDRINPTSRR
jgi:hypothetical protein